MKIKKKELIPNAVDMVITDRGRYLVYKNGDSIRLVSLKDEEVIENAKSKEAISNKSD